MICFSSYFMLRHIMIKGIDICSSKFVPASSVIWGSTIYIQLVQIYMFQLYAPASSSMVFTSG